jgi:putative sterol carrier protein
VNTVAPLAATRLTEDVMPAEMLERLNPALVTPLVLYLCSESCPVTGRIYNVGAGYHGRAELATGPGVWIGKGEEVPAAEAIADRWEEIKTLGPGSFFPNATAALLSMMTPTSEEEAGEAEEGVGRGVGSFFEGLPDLFQPEAAAGVEVVFQFSISGSGGGEWHVAVKEGSCRVEEGVHGQPTTTIKMEEGDFLKFVRGELPAMQAYTAGKLKVEGDLMKSQLIEKLFKL